jgi:hypothetical protein
VELELRQVGLNGLKRLPRRLGTHTSAHEPAACSMCDKGAYRDNLLADTVGGDEAYPERRARGGRHRAEGCAESHDGKVEGEGCGWEQAGRTKSDSMKTGTSTVRRGALGRRTKRGVVRLSDSGPIELDFVLLITALEGLKKNSAKRTKSYTTRIQHDASKPFSARIVARGLTGPWEIGSLPERNPGHVVL